MLRSYLAGPGTAAGLSASFPEQGTGDKQCPVVGAEALASAVEGSQLYIEKDGGHFAYFGCSEANRRKALSNLMKSGRSI